MEIEEPDLPDGLSCDVLVVGYGPVGIVCSALLADYGLDVVVVEKHQERYKLHRAGHLDGEIMRVFQRLGVAEAVELVAQPLVSMQLMTPGGETLSTVESGRSGSGWRSDYLAYQPDYEPPLDRRARELGVRVYMGTAAESITEHADGVRTVVRSAADPGAAPRTVDSRTVESRYVIGADGAGSFVRSAIGAQRLDLGFEAVPHLVVDLEWSDPDLDLPGLPAAAQVLDVERPHLTGRWGGRRGARWEFAAREGESRDFLESEQTAWDLIGRWGVRPEHGKIVRHTVYTFESSVSDPWRVGRVLLMGDAAHTMPPFMGQGMLSGIRDADNLAWKLAAVLAGRADEALLDTYRAEREPHVRDFIELSCRMGATILTTDPERAAARDEMLRSGRGPEPVVPRLGTAIVRSPHAPGALDAPAADGRPSLQARVALDTRVDRLDEQFPTRGWRIVSRHPVPRDLFDERQLRLLDSLDMQFAHISRGAHGTTSFYDIDAEYDRWYLGTGRKVFLERPDHYVYGTAATVEEVPALVDELADALARHGWHAAYAPADHR
jgi:2-polyprenyl-6-methoxyphenol hydroxylase-like FAD-dependent oxidoreductase